MHPSFVGTWIFHQERPFLQDVVLTIHSDGRLIQFFRQTPGLSLVVASTMRASAEADQYRIKTESAAAGYIVSMFREGEALVIENCGHRTVCRRLSEAELPDWYAEIATRAVWR